MRYDLLREWVRAEIRYIIAETYDEESWQERKGADKAFEELIKPRTYKTR